MLRIVLAGCRSSCSSTDTLGCLGFQTCNANNVGEKILLVDKFGVCWLLLGNICQWDNHQKLTPVSTSQFWGNFLRGSITTSSSKVSHSTSVRAVWPNIKPILAWHLESLWKISWLEITFSIYINHIKQDGKCLGLLRFLFFWKEPRTKIFLWSKEHIFHIYKFHTRSGAVMYQHKFCSPQVLSGGFASIIKMSVATT